MKQIIAVLFLTTICGIINAQNLKFGKPTNEELVMTVYENDPDASAVVLCQLTTVSYTIDYFNYFVDYQVKKRIKILKDEGKEYANISFRYIFNEKEQNAQESVTEFSATAYNMENGKLSKTKINKEKIHTERLNEDYILAKFAVPQVKVGTVIEYEYTIHSNVYYHIYDWYAQEDIPVAYTKYELNIPTLFMFNVEVNGIKPIENEVTEGAIKYKATTNNLSEYGTCKTNIYTCIGRDMPALKKDEFIWNIHDYTTKVTAELKGIYTPDQVYHEIRKTWDQIDDQLLSHPEFGGRMKDHSKYRDELEKLGIKNMEDLKDKVCATFTLLRNKLAWNGKYDLSPHPASDVIKRGSGSNADLNMILINMLGDVGVKAVPVIMSTRANGHLPQSYPSLNKINTFIVGIPNGASMLYLDASANNGYLNVLPPNLYSDQARILQKGEQGKWVNLQKIGDGKTIIDMEASLSADGVLDGTETVVYTGNTAANEREAFGNANDSIAFVGQKAKENDIEIIECQITGHKEFSPTVKETIHFKKSGDLAGDVMYINPFPDIPIRNSPYLSSERLLPVEFPFKQFFSMNIRMKLPSSWELDEIPERIMVASSDNTISGHIAYDLASSDVLTIQYLFKLNNVLYTSDKYDTLKQLFDLFASRSKDMLVLKRIKESVPAKSKQASKKR